MTINNLKYKHMKLLQAYIRQRKTEEVYTTLRDAGYCCMTFIECEGTGQFVDHEKEHISEKHPYADAYKVTKLEILLADEHVDEVVNLVRKYGRTGYWGDGLIIEMSADEVYKIRSDEKGLMKI